jgi:hypothetical protein
MAASLKGKRTPITTPPYQVPSVDITTDPPIFSLVTTFNTCFYKEIGVLSVEGHNVASHTDKLCHVRENIRRIPYVQ